MKKSPLRIFSLNCEYWKYSSTFLPFLDTIQDDFDVFCFQEVPYNATDTTCFEDWYDPHFYEKITTTLTEFDGYYCEYVRDSFGIATFIRKELKQKYRGEEYIFGSSDSPFLDKKRWNNATKCMCIKVENIDIVNLHGAWQPKSKKQDTPERLMQSRILRNLSRWKEYKTILIGDFNLMPNTESVRILEKKYTNLITQYGINSTRTAVYDDMSLPFADYAFVWSDLEVLGFQVQLDPIFSDHWFMILMVSRP